MASATRVACNKEGNGIGGKSDGNEGGGRASTTKTMATATAMTWVMATATRVAGNKKGNGKGGKSDGINDEGGV